MLADGLARSGISGVESVAGAPAATLAWMLGEVASGEVADEA